MCGKLFELIFGCFNKFSYLCSQIARRGPIALFFPMIKTTYFIRLLTVAFLVCYSLSMGAQEAEQIIEHDGNKYIIHVDRLNPDQEMTLLDVLHICPELMSTDGKTLTADYLLCVDEITLNIDYEPLLNQINACDLSAVTVFVYGNVNNAMDGVTGYIDLQFKEGKGLTGKLGINGSTYGNGQLYANVANRGDNVTVRALAQTNLQYGKAESSAGTTVTSRNGVENAMLLVDWQITDDDLLKFKLSQGYGEQKDRMQNIEDESMLSRQRWGELVATYERNLNEQGAGLYFEAGMNYTSDDLEIIKNRTASPWWIAEASFPLMKQALTVTIGYEGGYVNDWYQDINREQYLYNDLYVLLDYKKGPWTINLGDRFRHNTFWNRQYDKSDEGLWSHNRNDHALIASVGYHKGRHSIQGVFNRSFFNPVISNFIDYLAESSSQYNSDYKTQYAWRSELRYTYQTERLVVTGSATHTLLTDLPTPNQSLTGLGASVTWNKGPLRLTGGANVYHQHLEIEELTNDDTFFTLKFAPTLLLGNGFRLSSVLLFSSKKDLLEQRAHLYASVKVNKDLGKRCNVFADFHDIAGQPETTSTLALMQSYKNRALTIGLAYYPWR